MDSLRLFAIFEQCKGMEKVSCEKILIIFKISIFVILMSKYGRETSMRFRAKVLLLILLEILLR